LAVILRIAHALPGVGQVAQGCISLAIAVALAWLIYITVEKPCARLRRKLTD
jgi:peptidoglycan/LPS O-acetylase OafA/YrhL